MTWSNKSHGFESGGSRERSFNKRRQLPDLEQYRIGVLTALAKNNIPVKEMPDGTILAKFGTDVFKKTPADMEADWIDHINRMQGTEFPFEEFTDY